MPDSSPQTAKPALADSTMNCRLGCGACCIAPSINNPIPGMPNGKPSGVRCVQLDEQNLCMLFGKPERPNLCAQFSAEVEFCGENSQQAYTYLIELEKATLA